MKNNLLNVNKSQKNIDELKKMAVNVILWEEKKECGGYKIIMNRSSNLLVFKKEIVIDNIIDFLFLKNYYSFPIQSFYTTEQRTKNVRK